MLFVSTGRIFRPMVHGSSTIQHTTKRLHMASECLNIRLPFQRTDRNGLHTAIVRSMVTNTISQVDKSERKNPAGRKSLQQATFTSYKLNRNKYSKANTNPEKHKLQESERASAMRYVALW